MSFGFTRDSVVWWLAVLGAIMTYLIASPPPVDWTYHDWLRSLAMVVSTLAGKLATSPLPHSIEGSAKVTKSGQ